MATPINKILTNQQQVFSPEELANVSASLSAILGQGGGGGEPCASAWLPSVSDAGVISWTLTTATTEPTTANIKGPSGDRGPAGTSGTNGTDGKDGISPTFTIAPTAGGTHVTISGAQGEEGFDVLSGAKGADGQNGQNGAPGADGISPTFTTSVTSDEQHPQGGTHVVISGAGGESAFNVWNGVDGTGATVDLLEGTGIHITHAGNSYTIGVSADYALKSELPDVTDMATQTWVEQQSYLPTSGGTVSGKLTVSGSDFDHSLEIIRGGAATSASTGQVGINGAGGLSFKINRENNNTQLNIAPNATMDKRFSIGDNPYSPAAYFIPAVTSTTTDGLTDDGILHIIVEN